MRTKASPVMYFNFSGTSSIKVAQDYRAKYEAISRLLDDNPALLTLAHRDWARVLSTSAKERQGYSSEQLLRALIVMFIEGDSYRDAVIRIDTSEFLQTFVRLGVRPMMDFTFLNKTFCVLSDRTLEAMNRIVARYAVQQGKISGEKQRMNTTVYETNIHYPTDSSLLWDSFRTLARLLRCLHNELPQLNLQHRYHDKKVKRRMTFIARNASSKSKSTQRKVKMRKKMLIMMGIAILLAYATFTLAVDIEWVPVVNPGNTADETGYGEVTYNYNISKYEVSNSEYRDFLNSDACVKSIHPQ